MARLTDAIQSPGQNRKFENAFFRRFDRSGEREFLDGWRGSEGGAGRHEGEKRCNNGFHGTVSLVDALRRQRRAMHSDAGESGMPSSDVRVQPHYAKSLRILPGDLGTFDATSPARFKPGSLTH